MVAGTHASKVQKGLKALKICFISPPLEDCGGLQRVLAVIADVLAERHQVTIISLNNESGTSYYELSPGIKVINYNDFHYDKKRIPARLIRGTAKKYNLILPAGLAAYAYYPEYVIRGVLYLLQGGGYDCIVGVTVHCSVLLGMLADRLPEERLIGWHHNSFEIYFRTPVHGYYIQSRLSEEVLKRLDALVVLTRADVREYAGWKLKLCGHIYNPLSFSSEKKADMNQKTLLFLGRLERKQKGIDLLLNMIQNLFQKRGYHDWKLQIVGDGSGYEETKQQILDYGLEDQVELPGRRKNVIDYYTGASVFLLPSRWEGFGMVVTEAMECGLPVVSFRTDGPSEIIEDGVNGYLIENYDLKAFEDAVERLMRDVELRHEFSVNAVRRAEDFYPETIAECWEKLMSEGKFD